MKPGLQLKLSQHLALTPQLQQSIRLLQLSTLELSQEIEQAMNDNPLLERDDDPLANSVRLGNDGSIVPERSAPATSENSNEGGSPGEGDSQPEQDSRADEPLDWGRAASTSDDEDSSPANWAAQPTNLREHLLSQLSCTQASHRDRGLIEFLIEALDDDGYLSAPLEEVIEFCPAEAEVDLDELRAALRLLQSFDPPGVGARGAGECLALQLKALVSEIAPADRNTHHLALQIVSERLPLLAQRDFAQLKKHYGCSDEELRAAHRLICRLNPHPGVAFNQGQVDYVVPDIILKRSRDRWVATLNPEVMPKLRVNQAYADILKRDKKDRGDASQHAQWAGRLQEARWLIRNIQQRFETILRVSQAIVERQQAFFTHGEIAMRPLVLREIAEQVGLHESTISRVTASKYMATPFGVLELKYFFGSHVSTDAGGAASSTAIRALIKQLVSAEDPQAPLSDSRIAELLGEQGLVVARRTVAKYREALKIAPVALRKAL
ncbi:MAG: RNA polymerase factor sigma-54 [Burkholderiaceae bacterium]